MKVQVLGSSSAGNSYILNDEVIIELGLPALEIKRGLGFDLRKVRFALVSHKHKDHSKSLADFKGMFPIIAPADALRDADAEAEGIQARELKGLKVGEYKILPLAMVHDCECYGYVIYWRGESLGFFTDTCLINYNLPQLDYLLIEANYSKDILDKQLFDGVVAKPLHDRITRSHLSVEHALQCVLAQENLKTIVLIHLSENNAYPQDFKQLFERKTGIETYIARKGIVIDL